MAPGFGHGLAWIALLVLLLSCGPPPVAEDEAEPTASEPVFRIARGGDLASLDPMTSEFFTVDVMSNVFEGLVAHDDRMALRPRLAVEWSSLDDLTWSFRLRPGVRFHDGSPLTAAVVQQAFDRVLEDPDAPGRQFLNSVARVSVAGDMEIQIKTSAADPLLLQRLAQFRIALGATSVEVIERMAGTGPYRFGAWDPGERVVLEAHEDYWGGAPELPAVEFVQLDREQRLPALERGEIDLMALVTPIEVGPESEIEVITGPSLGRLFLWFTGEPTATQDPRVRQAVSLALDRPALVEAVMGEGALTAHQLVPRLIFGHVAGLESPPADLVRARELLVEAGWDEGFTLPILHHDSPLHAEVARLAGDRLAQIGIQLEPRVVGMDQIIHGFQTEGGDPLLSFWTYDDGDAGGFLRDCLRTRDPDLGRGLLNPGFSSPLLDQWIDAALTEIDPVARQQLYEEIMRQALEEVPVVPLLDQTTHYAVRRGVALAVRADARIDVAAITRTRP